MDSDSLPDLSSILSDQDFLDLLDSRDLYANVTGESAQNNIFNSGNDALMYLLSNGVDSPGTTLLANTETPKTPNVPEERLLHTPGVPTNTPYSPTDTPYSPTPIRPPAPSYSLTPDLKVESEYDPYLPQFSPISTASLSSPRKNADFKDDDIFMSSEDEIEEREKALIRQLDQLVSDVKPPIMEEYMELGPTHQEDTKLVFQFGLPAEAKNEIKTEVKTEVKPDLKNFLGEPMRHCTGDSNCPDKTHIASGIFTNTHKYVYSLYLPQLLHLLVMLYTVTVDSDNNLLSCLLCANAVAMKYDRMSGHVKNMHGHTVGCPATKEDIVTIMCKIKREEIDVIQTRTLPCCVMCVGTTVPHILIP